MKILVLDNYDSFTYNLVHIVKNIAPEAQVSVFRNDAIALADVAAFDKILLSPGPGLPHEAGIMPKVIAEYASKKSILGVCLGLQAIAEAFGGSLRNLREVFHGVATPIKPTKQEDYLYRDLPNEFLAGRYHSWIVEKNNLPDELLITATDDKGEIMSLMHREYDLRGVQFHPESVLTAEGTKLISNWIFHKQTCHLN